ncbi:MAG: endonuclease III [Planctomycetota bacterium]|nr:endonuclease III [Planctomycetota bacterium]
MKRAKAPLKKTPLQRARAVKIFKALAKRYPDAHCELDATAPHELLIATILSAQSTDVGVNKATPALFLAFPTPADYARSSPKEIEPYLATLNFWHNKALAIHSSMTTIVNSFGGEVPRTMNELLTLRGVARKTANVVLGNCFGIQEGIVVDTHVLRLSKRLGWTRHTDPLKVEGDLMALFDQTHWTLLSHLLIFHGRRVCKARGGVCQSDSICQLYCSDGRSGTSAHRTGSNRSRPSRQKG